MNAGKRAEEKDAFKPPPGVHKAPKLSDIIDEWRASPESTHAPLPVEIKNWCVQACSERNVPGFYEICRDLPLPPNEVSLNAIKDGTSKDWTTKGVNIFLAYANFVLRGELALPPIKLEDYTTRPFKGPDAVQAFMSWLLRLDDQLVLLPPPLWTAMPDECAELTKTISAFVRGGEERLLVVRAIDAACASIGQFAAQFVTAYRNEPERMPVFYASVGRPGRPLPKRAKALFSQRSFDPAGDAPLSDEALPAEYEALDDVTLEAERALAAQASEQAHDPLDDRLGAGGERMSLPLLVHLLKSFLSASDPRRSSPPHDAPSLWGDILEIRKLLALRPVLLVFDGYSAMGQSFASLRSMLTGDPLSVLIPHLLEDWPGDVHNEATRDNVGKSRIVIFSDADAYEFRRYDPATANWPMLEAAFVGETFRAATRWQILDVGDKTERLTHMPFTQFAEGLDLQNNPITDEDVWALLEAERRLGVESDAPGLRDRGIENSLPRFLDYLKQHAPLALLILRFMALSPGGLRYTTLYNLISQWRQIDHQEPHLILSKPVSIRRIIGAARALQPLLLEVTDDFAQGLDDAPRPWAYLDPPAKPAISPRLRLRMADFRSRRLRELVHDHLANPEPEAAARMHRLLAEEFLRQHIIITRHRPEKEPFPVDALQSVSQMLLHGWASLARGPDAKDLLLKDLPRTLPIEPTKIYLRLYSIFFRQLVDGDQRGDTAARIINVEALKSDLLRVAISVDLLREDDQKTFFYQRSATADANMPSHIPSFLRAVDSDDTNVENEQEINTSFTDEERIRIALEQLRSFAQSLLAQDRLPVAGGVGTYARRVLNAHGAQLTERERASFAADLGHIELQIGRVQDPGDYRIFNAALTRIRWEREEVDKVVTAVREKTTVPDPPPGRPRFKLLEESARLEAETMAKTIARTDAGFDEMRIKSQYMGDFADILWTEVESAPADRAIPKSALLSAFIAFRLSEHLRRLAFDMRPHPAHAIGDSHHVRSFVRVALRLASELGGASAEEQDAYPPAQYFIKEARRQADLQALFFGFTNADRASIHMLESRFYWLGDRKRFDEAWQCLIEAERWMLPTADRPRVRYRLLYERASVARERAREAVEVAQALAKGARQVPAGLYRETVAELKSAAWWIRQAQHDLGRLRAYAREPYWERLLTRGQGSLAQVSTDYDRAFEAVTALQPVEQDTA